jgi:hypothetical protein
MSRIRLTILSGFVAIGTLGFEASPSRAQDRYSSGPTYVVAERGPVSGSSIAPTQAPAHSATRYLAPARTYHAAAPSVPAWNYDPSGRHDRLARPWLRSSR